MKKLFYPSALLLYPLTILVLFVLRAMVAGLASAEETKGLAGTAYDGIVLYCGMMISMSLDRDGFDVRLDGELLITYSLLR